MTVIGKHMQAVQNESAGLDGPATYRGRSEMAVEEWVGFYHEMVVEQQWDDGLDRYVGFVPDRSYPTTVQRVGLKDGTTLYYYWNCRVAQLIPKGKFRSRSPRLVRRVGELNASPFYGGILSFFTHDITLENAAIEHGWRIMLDRSGRIVEHKLFEGTPRRVYCDMPINPSEGVHCATGEVVYPYIFAHSHPYMHRAIPSYDDVELFLDAVDAANCFFGGSPAIESPFHSGGRYYHYIFSPTGMAALEYDARAEGAAETPISIYTTLNPQVDADKEAVTNVSFKILRGLWDTGVIKSSAERRLRNRVVYVPWRSRQLYPAFRNIFLR